jgi:hypothetical protein
MTTIRLQPLLCSNPHCECHKAAKRGKGPSTAPCQDTAMATGIHRWAFRG